MSEETQVAGLVAALNAGGCTAFASDKVPATLPPGYTEVHAYERLPQTLRSDGTTATRSWAVLLRFVGDKVVNAQRQREKARQALLWRSLVIDGTETSAFAPSLTDDPIGPDGGWYSGVSEYAYTH